ncbi:hypothetical protein [Brasilonema sp. UFV-L1]|uniref:hypothetical protein n=1 Tax=Brasilonema sp. UFV-L1 TaxID=2234130 RepID=UPI0030D8210B
MKTLIIDNYLIQHRQTATAEVWFEWIRQQIDQLPPCRQLFLRKNRPLLSSD